jgi:hypothetical protein
MRAREFWKAVTLDETHFLETFVGLLEGRGVRYCLIGGQAVNAYVEPLVSLDLDVVVAADQLDAVRSLLASHDMAVEPTPHSLNVSQRGSDLRIQIQTDPRYGAFVDRCAERTVLGMALPVARVDDVLQGKVWAAEDATRRGSKRQKDLADIARLLEAFPDLGGQVPPAILARLA